MYSRRHNTASVPFALHDERYENSDLTVEKTVSKRSMESCNTLLERCEDGENKKQMA